MQLYLHPSWKKILSQEIEKPYFLDLINFVTDEYSKVNCFPPIEQIFNAFNLCLIEDVKVVIIGQDPYHGFGQAHGLAFSVNDGIAFPPSLQNIFKELKNDLNNEIPISGNLEHWAKQGVLLLNATLTVEESKAGSHQNRGWEKFTDAVINIISTNKNNVVFMLWGSFAQKKGAKIDVDKHLVLKTGHPSPLSANRGYWFNNRHFSNANNYLESMGISPIIW